MDFAISGSINRLANSRPAGAAGYAGALAIVGAAIVVLELFLADLDHGTHLLVGLAIVVGAVVLLGPGPAASGLLLGATASVAVAATTIEGILYSPLTYLQVLTYLIVGGAVIALVSFAIRVRASSAGPVDAAGGVAPQPRLTEPLTERELEILRLAASGISVGEMADRLFLSPNTVKTHLTHVYAKLGVRGRPDAVRAGIHFGCLTPSDICPHRYPHATTESPIPVRPETPEPVTTPLDRPPTI